MTAVDNYFPFDTGAGENATMARWRSMARLFCKSGVIPGYLNQLSCTIAGGVVTVNTGGCFIDGFYGESLTTKTLSTSGNGMIVARMDPGLREVLFAFVGNQTVPQQSLTGIFEIPLYQLTSGVLVDNRPFLDAVNREATPTPIANIARAKVYRAGAFTTPTVVANFPFDTVSYGTGFAVPSGIYTCPYGADYFVYAQASMSSTGTGQWYNLQICHTAAGVTTATAWNGTPNATTPANMACQVTDIVSCKAGDTLFCQHRANAAVAGVPGGFVCFMVVRALS